jgi:hypothetical protein
VSKAGTPSAKLINFGQARVERRIRQSVLPGETSLGEDEDRSAGKSAPAMAGLHQADPYDYDLGEDASNRAQRRQEPQFPLLEMRAAIRDLEHRIVRELRGSQGPGAAAADLEREVFRIGRRLEELNDLVEELRRSALRQSATENTLLTNAGSLEEAIVDLNLRVDSALASEHHKSHVLDNADQAKAQAARFRAAARSPVSANILASLEKTADEMRFAQSTWRRNLSQRTRASQKKDINPRAIDPDLLREQFSQERDASRAARTSFAQQRQDAIAATFEEMRDGAAESSEWETPAAPRHPSPPEANAAPQNANRPIKHELLNWQGRRFKQGAGAAFIEKAHLLLRRPIRGFEIAHARNRLVPKSLQGASILALVSLGLIAGGYSLFRTGAPVPKTNYASSATQPATKDESGERSKHHVGQADDGPTGTAGTWRGGLQELAVVDSRTGTPTAPSQLALTSGQADQAALSFSRSPTPLQLPSTPASTSASAGDIQALAEQGDAKAQYELATNLMNGHDAARNTKAAVRWLEKAANQELALAQLRLGIIYGRGAGVERNFALARKWFQAAAENGNALAMHNLAVLLSEGHGRAPDHASADVWFRKAAEAGIRDSQYNLGIDYMQGLGVEKDLVQSYAWFATAAAQGDTQALRKRKEVRALLDPEELDAAKALANSLIQKQPQTDAHN